MGACSGLTVTGAPCRRAAGDRRFCYWHDPERAEQATATRKVLAVAQPRRQEVSRQRRSQRRYPERHRARRLALRALKAGTLAARPCEDCGAEEVQMHHPDYSKPLEVEFLCIPCHSGKPRSPRHSPPASADLDAAEG